MAPQRILITGASSGIGRAVALRYAATGVSLILMGRNEERLNAVARACEAKGATTDFISADVQDRAAMASHIEQAFARAPIDLLIANAGVPTGLSTGMLAENPDSVRGVVAINLIGVFNTVEPAIPLMAARKSGHIAIVGSMAGLRGLPYSPAYCAAKAATHLWAESIRGVLTPHGVDVTLIIPGFVETPMSAQTKSWQPGAISAERAADIIGRGLERNKAVIAFPLFMYYALRFFTFLPPRLVDAVMRLFPATVPETHERAKP